MVLRVPDPDGHRVEKDYIRMKTMTCRQMGGPCDTAFHGNTADEVIKAGETHIREVVANGDQAHKGPLQMMDDMRKIQLQGWNGTRKCRVILPHFLKNNYLYRCWDEIWTFFNKIQFLKKFLLISLLANKF